MSDNLHVRNVSRGPLDPIPIDRNVLLVKEESPLWMSKETATHCFKCNEGYGMFNKPYHCKVISWIFFSFVGLLNLRFLVFSVRCVEKFIIKHVRWKNWF